MLLEVKNLSKIYKTGKISTTALSKANFNIAEGSICVVLGPSGSGKSTLLNIIGGIDRADEGEVFVNNINITKLSDNELTWYTF